jgi:hypothetical protein
VGEHCGLERSWVGKEGSVQRKGLSSGSDWSLMTTRKRTVFNCKKSLGEDWGMHYTTIVKVIASLRLMMESSSCVPSN